MRDGNCVRACCCGGGEGGRGGGDREGGSGIEFERGTVAAAGSCGAWGIWERNLLEMVALDRQTRLMLY